MKADAFKEYSTDELKKIQSLELGILKDFIALCDRKNLTYWGIAGSGIGALRHKGFIPWDDDIDVAMMRKDHDILIRAIEEEMGDTYRVINFERDPNYPLMTTRIMLKGTKFKEEPLKNIKCDLGIFLDLYPFDAIPDDERLFKKQARQAFFWSKILILRSIPFPVVGFSGILKLMVHAACGMLHFLLRLFNVPKKKIQDRCYRISTKYNYMKNSERIDFLCDTTAYMNIYRRKDVFPVVKLPFEDLKMSFPNNLHDNLTGMYGDYMKLPPVEKRKNHYPYELDFGSFGRE